jgi:hypothetical protein
MRGDARDPDARDEARKPYAEPRLIEYGSIAKLTQTGAGSRFDFSGMRMVGTCL